MQTSEYSGIQTWDLQSQVRPAYMKKKSCNKRDSHIHVIFQVNDAKCEVSSSSIKRLKNMWLIGLESITI
ncbi:unnamed protein product [Malus baccata var. baccata]